MRELDACPHAEVVDDKADHRQGHEDDELAAPAHPLFVGENVAHRGQVVEDDGRGERNRGAHQVVHAESFRQKCEQAVVDDERDHADDAEFHKLCDKFLHDIRVPFERASQARAPYAVPISALKSRAQAVSARVNSITASCSRRVLL